jgi:cation transport ATPase
MKDYKNVRIDDVLLYTASMVINSDGPLAEVFKKVISNSSDLLPAVKSLGYEDKMGLSGIILKQKVLFGTRNLLLNHGVEVPNERNEAKYCHDGRRVLYLAIANKIAAMFVVSYAYDLSLAPYLKYLESSGINILVRNSDPNITENLLNGVSGFREEL